jgi:mannose-6-phosphate isomerase-like protein (cupin superfamily)
LGVIFTPEGSLFIREADMSAIELHSETSRQQPVRAHWFYGDLAVIHVSGEETDGRFALLEFLQPPGEMTPLHVHRDADQTMCVLEGELTLFLPGKTLVAGPGEVVYGPMNVPHTEQVTSPGPVRLLGVTTPAGFERFVVAAGRPAAELTLPPASLPPVDFELLARIAAEHRIEVLGPPGALP